MAKKKKKVYAPTEQELALPQEYMTLKASPLKESGGILLDRTATILSNWTILGSIIGALLLLGPVVYSVVAMLAVMLNFLVIIFVVVGTVGFILLAMPFTDMMPTLALMNGEYAAVIWGQILPVATIVVFVLSIASSVLLIARSKTSPVWRIVVSVLIFLLYLIVLIWYHNGGIVYG